MTPDSSDALLMIPVLANAARKAPVMVWIHGGALSAGYSSSSMYEAANIAAKSGYPKNPASRLSKQKGHR